MATMQNNDLGLVEIAKRTNNGNVLTVAEALSRMDEVFMDGVWVPCNQLASHVHTRRTVLPTGTWRKINIGAAIESSHTKQVVEAPGRLEAWSQIDEATLQTLLGDQAKFRSTEDMAFAMGLAQTAATALVSGDTLTTPEKFDGFNIRLNAAGTYVLSSGGTGSDLTSVYFVQWGEDMVHFIFQPEVGHGDAGSPIKVNPKGLETITDSDGGLFAGYRTQFVLSMGLAVHDDRCIARMANIEDDVSGANLFEPDYAIGILNSMLNRGRGVTMYAHQKVLSQIDVMAMDKLNVLYQVSDLFGEPVTRFRGSPVRQLDAITITQSAVS